jgi:HAD superfamily hydrolase (TIGR01549 family)
MLKALFLDLDETLCDTSGANIQALDKMAEKVEYLFKGEVDPQVFVGCYLKGIYRELDERYAERLLPVVDEGKFRLALIEMILIDCGVNQLPADAAKILQETFDQARSECFDFFPGIKDMLRNIRQHVTLVVITNGPEFSQIAKVEAVSLHEHVDHIIIGGQEPEEKPAASIFFKALKLAQCEAHEAIHIGDSLKADIAGANNSQIPSIWISHGNELDDSHGATPDHILASPLELTPFLESLLNTNA